jgi:hypothetical protein
MKLFHITGNKNAEAILNDGFRDGTGYYLTHWEWSGVWVSDKPFDESYQDDTNTLFAIDIPEEDISEWEWLVLASDLNSYGPPVVREDYDSGEIVPHPGPGAFMGDFDMGEFLWMDNPKDWMDK